MSAADAVRAAEEEIPTLEAADPQYLNSKQSKRYVKAMAKMGLKPEPQVSKVLLRNTGSFAFSVAQPEVYRFPGAKAFVIFGEAQPEDMEGLTRQAAAHAAVSSAAADIVSSSSAPAAASAVDGEGAAATSAKEDKVALDAGDLAEKEIKIVMGQANVSRNQGHQGSPEQQG